MIDVLLLADLHGEYGKLDPFLDLNPDAIFIAGDLTNMGPAESVTAILDRIDVPCFAVPGNCDPRDTIDVLEHSDCVCLHGAHISLGKISICGVGGSNPTPFHTLFELTDKQIDDILHAVLAKRERAIHNVLISHAPPFGLLDRANGNHVGSQSVRRHLTEFDLICCAHIHEEKGIMTENGVKVVNPGMAAAGDCAMIHFGNDPQEIEIELITV